jgi:hypothetical protein
MLASLLLPATLIISAAAVDSTVAFFHTAVGVLVVADVPSCARLLFVIYVIVIKIIEFAAAKSSSFMLLIYLLLIALLLASLL